MPLIINILIISVAASRSAVAVLLMHLELLDK